MAERYQHLIDSTRQDVARQVGTSLWGAHSKVPEELNEARIRARVPPPVR